MRIYFDDSLKNIDRDFKIYIRRIFLSIGRGLFRNISEKHSELYKVGFKLLVERHSEQSTGDI